MKKTKNVKIHPTAEISDQASIGEGTCIWNNAQIREKVVIGKNCIISKNVYIDFDVVIGNNVKIQNNVSVYHGVTIEEGVFIGPHVCLINDKNPRAINPNGSLKSASDWEISKIMVKKGASIGANSTILPGITIGEFAMIGSGSVVTKNIPNYGLVFGNPAKLIGFVCSCGAKLEKKEKLFICTRCNKNIDIPQNVTKD